MPLRIDNFLFLTKKKKKKKKRYVRETRTFYGKKI